MLTTSPGFRHNRGGGWRFGIWPRQNFARTWTPGAFLSRALFRPVFIKTEYLRECSASRVRPYMHQLRIMSFGQMLGLPGSCVLLPYVLLYRLRRHQENYCDCAPVRPGEHLSRESRKLTIMMQRETGQPLDRPRECLEFLRFDEGSFPGQAHTRLEFGERGAPRGYVVAPPSNSMAK